MNTLNAPQAAESTAHSDDDDDLIHIVSDWQHILGRLGWPKAPTALCGELLVSDEPPEHEPGPAALICPVCLMIREGVGRR